MSVAQEGRQGRQGRVVLLLRGVVVAVVVVVVVVAGLGAPLAAGGLVFVEDGVVVHTHGGGVAGGERWLRPCSERSTRIGDVWARDVATGPIDWRVMDLRVCGQG
eukprot:1773565-Pyramimonas_sp.AAC.1